MVEIIQSREPAFAAFSVYFETEVPFSSRIVADLLSALSADYRRAFKGRDLSIVRLETGSLFVVLADAASFASEMAPYAKQVVEAAKGGKALLDFAKAIRDVFKQKGLVTKSEPVSPALDINRSVDALADAATATGSEVTLTERKADGTITTLKITPKEIEKARMACKAEVARAKAASRSVAAERDAEQVSKYAQLIANSAGLRTAPAAELESVINSLVLIIVQMGEQRIADAILEQLLQNGDHHTAAIFRSALIKHRR